MERKMEIKDQETGNTNKGLEKVKFMYALYRGYRTYLIKVSFPCAAGNLFVYQTGFLPVLHTPEFKNNIILITTDRPIALIATILPFDFKRSPCPLNAIYFWLSMSNNF
jgi:hypothetical protein